MKRCDSKRVLRLVFVAKSVTGQVRWQVTGRKPTFSVSLASDPAGPVRAWVAHGFALRIASSDHEADCAQRETQEGRTHASVV